ncbi:MAG: DsrE-like protein [Acidobacteriaceae bacterium]|nr:DsrE-like protein [Acidobacteriaceae bacterium]
MPTRRSMLQSAGHAYGAVFAGASAASAVATEPESSTGQKFLLVGLCGSENPTRANFPFVWAAALKDAGNEVRIEIAGDATVLMRTPVSDSVTPVGWPPFKDALAKVIELKIPIFV